MALLLLSNELAAMWCFPKKHFFFLTSWSIWWLVKDWWYYFYCRYWLKSWWLSLNKSLFNNCLALVFWHKDDERVPMICVQTERFQYSFLGKDFWTIYRSRESFPCFSKKNNIILEAIDPTKKRCTLILVRALFIYILSTIIYFVAWFFLLGYELVSQTPIFT